MAFTKNLWLVALLGLNSLTTLAFPTATSLEARPEDDIKLPPSVPAKIKITDPPNDPAGKLVKLRYGPLVVPANSMFSVLPKDAGGPEIHKPCKECYLGAFQGGLEYEDGSEANVDTGMYLHHFVLVNNNKPDWLCGLRMNSMFRSQYVYNSGNERPPVRLNSKYKFGMRVDKEDTFGTAGEIMNMSNQTKTVYATIIYEVIPLETPGYREATHLRLDVWMCGASDVPAKLGAYKYTGPKYKSPYSGVILHVDGHGHDGTTEVKMHQNGKVFCNSIQYYGLRPSWTQPFHIAIHHGDSKTEGMQYISDAVACEDTGRLEKGDEVWTEAFYNGTKYPQMVFRGHRENQMGISFLYIGRDEHTLKDKLLIEDRYDMGLPIEMNVTQGPYGRRPVPQAKSGPVNITTLFPYIPAQYIEAVVPPGFNFSEPYVEKPLPPLRIPRKPQQTFNVSSFLPGLPPKIAKELTETSVTMFEGLLKSYVPSIPKDFRFANLYSPGGMVISEMEGLMNGIRKASGVKDPMADVFGESEHVEGGHMRRLMVRSLYRQ